MSFLLSSLTTNKLSCLQFSVFFMFLHLKVCGCCWRKKRRMCQCHVWRQAWKWGFHSNKVPSLTTCTNGNLNTWEVMQRLVCRIFMWNSIGWLKSKSKAAYFYLNVLRHIERIKWPVNGKQGLSAFHFITIGWGYHSFNLSGETFGILNFNIF